MMPMRFACAAVLREATELLGEAAYRANLVFDNYDRVADPRAELEVALQERERCASRIRPLGSLWPVLEKAPLTIGVAGTVINTPMVEVIERVTARYRRFLQ
jgi:hypothetical protein